MLLGNPTMECAAYVYRGLTYSAGPSQNPSTSPHISDSTTRQQPDQVEPHNPTHATPVSYHTHAVWPHPRSLATTNGITIVFSSYGY